MARRGEAATNAHEALLVVAIARQGLPAIPWVVGASFALALLAGYSALMFAQRDDWFVVGLKIAVVVLAIANGALWMFWRLPRLRRAEQMNLGMAKSGERSGSAEG